MIKGGTRAPGLFCATVGLSAVVTAGFGWLEVLTGWCIGAIIRSVTPEWQEMQGKKGLWWALIVCGILSAGVLVLAEQAFPQDSTFPFVSLGLLLLMYRTLIGEKETGRMVSNLLGMVLLVLFGIMLLVGFPAGDMAELATGSFHWRQVWITMVLGCAWWREKEQWSWYTVGAVIAVAMSGLCRVCLGAALTVYSPVPIYRAAQSIEVMGVPQHMEGLIAAGVLLGAYSMLCQIGEGIRSSGEKLFANCERRLWCSVELIAILLLEWGYRILKDGARNRINTVFWGLTGIIALLVVILRKMKKVLDKWRVVE